MKNFILTIVISIVAVTTALGQFPYETITFDDTTNMSSVSIDTINFHHNIWQIGKPQKTIFTSAYSAPNAIVTDTVNPYPINDTSQFVILHKVYFPTCSGYWWTSIYAKYMVNSDTLTDIGTIEFSFDIGKTWVNVLSDTNIIIHNCGDIPPVLSGNSNGWKSFNVEFNPNYAIVNPVVQNGDTVLIRFTFISDSVQTNKDGLMFDYIQIGDMSEGIEERGFENIQSTVFPNPVADNLNIKFDNKTNSGFVLTILDSKGNLVKTLSDLKNSSVNVGIKELSSGIYYYKLTNTTDKKYTIGKFIK